MRRKIIRTLFFLTLAFVLLGGFALNHFLQTLPSTQTLEDYIPRLTTRVLDYKGNLVSEFYTERRVWIPLKDIPKNLQNAFIATEDDDFYDHWGISPTGMARAAIKNFIYGRAAQGGSTITQQLSKLIFLTQEKTLTRKIKELILAIQIEHKFSKQEILQMYLNQVYFGHGAYGVSAAAKSFFGKRVEDLNLAECALLAGLPRLPQYYSPFNHADRAMGRRATVLSRMLDLKYISKKEAKIAKEAPLVQSKTPFTSTNAPYFMEYLRQTLEPKYGTDILHRGGLTIHTTLDLRMQQAAERILLSNLEQFDKEYGVQAEFLRAKEKSAKLKASGAKNYTVKPSTTIAKVQGSLCAIDPRSGAIRAMIGGRNYNESQFNRATQSKRQPGSTFKPFIWLTALDNGFTLASLVNDTPIAFENDGRDWRVLVDADDPDETYAIKKATANLPADKVWVPENYDNEYMGPITLRKGLSRSRNVVSVRLINHVRPDKVIEWAKRSGIKSRLDPVLSLSLGTSVVSLLEMVNSFGTFAAEGIHREPYAITKIVDPGGTVLEENFPQESEAIPPQLNFLMHQAMRAVVTEGTAGAAEYLDIPVAGKTGTSQDQRDLWFVGYSPELVCGLWLGYDDYTALGKKLAAGGIVVPWWAQFMQEALKGSSSKEMRIPEGIVFEKIDRDTGELATSRCKHVILEAFIQGTEPKNHCNSNHKERKHTEKKH